MALDDKLQRLAERALKENERHYARERKGLGKLIMLALEQERHELLGSDVIEALDNLIETARVLDAARLLLYSAVEHKNVRVIGIKLKSGGDMQDAQERIEEALAEWCVPNRGFVYVAWCQKPEAFLYVGKAKNKGRLKLAQHGKLTAAILGSPRATRLSLLFPHRSTDDALLNVEGAVLTLLQRFDAFPSLNKQMGRAPYDESMSDLNKIGKALIRLGKHLC